MPKFTDHAFCDIQFTQDDVYKLRLAVRRQVEQLQDQARQAHKFGLGSNVEEYLIKRYSGILEKLDRSEIYWLDRGRFQLRFIEDGGCADE